MATDDFEQSILKEIEGDGIFTRNEYPSYSYFDILKAISLTKKKLIEKIKKFKEDSLGDYNGLLDELLKELGGEK